MATGIWRVFDSGQVRALIVGCVKDFGQPFGLMPSVDQAAGCCAAVVVEGLRGRVVAPGGVRTFAVVDLFDVSPAAIRYEISLNRIGYPSWRFTRSWTGVLESCES